MLLAFRVDLGGPVRDIVETDVTEDMRGRLRGRDVLRLTADDDRKL
jgi:hypothetical protein